jgi:phosphotriesterase-related protein
LLKRISEASGLNILTNTGYYAAANDRYVPRHAYQESAERLAGRWIDEWKHGIGETGIRPGFLKTGVDEGSLSDIDAKMIRAAAMTHRETGLTIASHTGDNPGSAAEQLEILEAHGVAATAWIWVHAHTVGEPAQLLPAAERGAWIELDGVSPENSEKHLRLVEFLKSRGYADQILLSHDGNSFRYGGRPSKAYDGLFTTFIPMLKSRDYSTEEINRLLAGNPFRALAPRVRRR